MSQPCGQWQFGVDERSNGCLNPPMNKLYAVKLKPIKSQINGGNIDAGHHTTLSVNEVAKFIKQKGIGCVELIRHDDKTPRNTRQLNRSEMLKMWQAVEGEK
jgi:hypothetical protein